MAENVNTSSDIELSEIPVHHGLFCVWAVWTKVVRVPDDALYQINLK